MTKEQAEKVVFDFQYLIGRIIDHLPAQPTVTHFSIIKDYYGEHHVMINAENPHPSIGDAWSDLLESYCKKVGIKYDFPASL